MKTQTNKVSVIGSLNMDIILPINTLPLAGETIQANAPLSSAFGGKGSNQAIACSRNGSRVTMIGCVGEDTYGEQFKEMLTKNQITADTVTALKGQKTGQAYILLQKSGQNSIIVSSEANAKLTPKIIQKNESNISDSDFVLSQFEVPLDAIQTGFELAKKHQVKTVLNPGPVIEQSCLELFKLTDIIIPNETESEKLTGITITDETSLENSAQFFHEKGIEIVIITLGGDGVFYSSAKTKQFKKIKAHQVKVVDTTAAGDTFIGALLSQLNLDFSNLDEAITYANFASSITVQRLGASDSIPTEEEVKDKIKKLS